MAWNRTIKFLSRLFKINHHNLKWYFLKYNIFAYNILWYYIFILGVGVSGKYDAMRLIWFLIHRPVLICKTAKQNYQFSSIPWNQMFVLWIMHSKACNWTKENRNQLFLQKEVLSVCFSYHKNWNHQSKASIVPDETKWMNLNDWIRNELAVQRPIFP